MARQCPCGSVIPVRQDYGPTSTLAAIKFYETADLVGHPTSRRKVHLCDKHTEEFIAFLNHVRTDGSDTE